MTSASAPFPCAPPPPEPRRFRRLAAPPAGVSSSTTGLRAGPGGGDVGIGMVSPIFGRRTSARSAASTDGRPSRIGSGSSTSSSSSISISSVSSISISSIPSSLSSLSSRAAPPVPDPRRRCPPRVPRRRLAGSRASRRRCRCRCRRCRCRRWSGRPTRSWSLRRRQTNRRQTNQGWSNRCQTNQGWSSRCLVESVLVESVLNESVLVESGVAVSVLIGGVVDAAGVPASASRCSMGWGFPSEERRMWALSARDHLPVATDLRDAMWFRRGRRARRGDRSMANARRMDIEQMTLRVERICELYPRAPRIAVRTATGPVGRRGVSASGACARSGRARTSRSTR